jgi:hypothetical protein
MAISVVCGLSKAAHTAQHFTGSPTVNGLFFRPLHTIGLASLVLTTRKRLNTNDNALNFSVDELFAALYKLASDDRPTTETRLWTPKLWTPGAQQSERAALKTITQPLLRALRSHTMRLADLKWNELECVVAEVLRGLGMQIHVVKERPQGGRDIIARGELIPGQEPIQMAVEVKHQRTVDRPQVQAALWQNRS